jgi:hypothetical protein
MLRIAFAFSVLLTATSAWASPLDVKSVELKLIEDQPSIQALDTKDCAQLTALAGEDSILDEIGWDQIVNIGQKVWEIVQAGKPVVNIETPVAYALPRGLNCWTDLEHWQAPRTQVYEVSYKNGFGMEVVKFRFRLHYTYGGGKAELGQYLANVSVLPAELNVLWGYNFDAKVEVQPAINLGTKENPIGGLELNVRWTVKTVLKESINSFHFFVQGDGVAKSAE